MVDVSWRVSLKWMLAARDVEMLGLRGTYHTSKQGVGSRAGLYKDALNFFIECVVGGLPRDKADTTLIAQCDKIRSLLSRLHMPWEA